MPKKKKSAPEPVAADEGIDPSVERAPRAAPAAPEEATLPTYVLPCKVAAPAALLPLWDAKSVASEFDEASGNAGEADEGEAAAENDGDAAAADPSDTAPYTDFSTRTTDLLPTELSAQEHAWKRPAELEALPFWSRDGDSVASESSDPVHGDASSPWCVVDFFVPPTKEEAAASAAKAEAAAKLAAEKEAARAAAEEAGEPLPEEDVAKDAEEPTPPPPPREILRSLKFSGAFPSQLVSVYELISSVSKSYAAKKAREAPPPPTEEEIAAAAAAAAAAAEEEAAAAAAKAKGKKKGKGDPEPEQEEVPVAPPSDPNDPIQPGAFLWEAIYPKTAPGSTTPRYNPSGRYAVRIFVNNAWRRVDVDDRIPVDSKEGRPLLPFSENKFELWPLIIAKAICVVTRGRWADAGCLTWINNLCGWVTESTLVAELPPGDDDLDGREHFQSLTMQTWPRILPAVPHQVIVYEEDSDSEEDGALGDDNEEDEGLFGAMDAAEGLLAGAGDGTDNGGDGQAENGGEEKTGSEADGSEGVKDGVSGSSSKALLLAGSPPFEIHLLMVGDDSVVANGANKVGAEAAEAALEEVYADPDAPKAPPPSLLARCVYHLVATRGGDDLVGVDLNDGVDDDMVVADDRDVQVSLGMSNAWLTLDNLLANFVDPINADRGSLVSLFSETTRLANQQSMEQTWQWSWCTTEQQETMDRIRDARAAKKAAAGTSEATTEDAPAELESPVEAGEEESIPEMPTFTTELVTPTTEGAWMRMPSEWGPRQVLHFPSDDDLVKEASDGAAESDEPPAAAAEAASEEAAASVPKLDTKCLQTRTFVVTLSNHLSMPSRFPKSIARIALREIGGNGAVHRIETSTITSSRFEYMGDTATFEVDLDAPAGASVTFSSDNEVRLLDHAVHAKNVLKRPHAYSVSGITKASGADDLQVAFRCHFNVPQATPATSDVEDGEAQAGADSGTGETSVSAGAIIDADLCVSDPLLRKYVHMLIVNEDTGEQTAVPLNRFRAQSFLPNRDGYTLMAFVHRRDGMLPPSNWRLTVSSSSPAEAITEFTQHTLNSVQDFSGAYIPNKYFRILRDVITASEPSEEDAEEAEENAIPKKPCPYTSVRFKLDNSDAAVILRAIVKETNAIIAEAIGRGEASLDHVPLQVAVRAPLDVSGDAATAEDAAAEAAEPEIVQSQVIVEAVLDETRYDVPVALRSLRPYHYPAGQEGDAPESYLCWTCRIISASGVKLARDQTQEEKEKAIREEWELDQEGRAVRAKAKRARYNFLNKKDAATAPATENTSERPADDAADAAGDGDEEEDGPVGPPDGMDGMDEEEKRVETERRAKLEALPPVTLRGHLMLPIPDTSKPSSPRGKKSTAVKPVKPRFVKRPGKYFTAQLTTASEAALEGAAVRSKFLTSMLVEQGRRRLTADRQLHKLRHMREKKIARMRKSLDERQALLFPEIAEAADE